jgi:DNA-binding beta-propeller fold protein YncE
MGFNQSKDQVRQTEAIITTKKKKQFYVYVSDAKKGTISIFNTVTCKLIKTMHVMKEELTELVMSRDGARLYATSYTCDAVYFFDVASCKLVKTIRVMGAASIAPHPDGKWLYVAGRNSFSDSTVYVINIATYEVVETDIRTGPRIGINVSPDEMQLYVSDLSRDTFHVFDTTNNYHRRGILPELFPSLSSYSGALVASLDRTKLYVAISGRRNGILVIDTSTFQRIGFIDIKYYFIFPYRLTISPDGTQLYVLQFDVTDYALRKQFTQLHSEPAEIRMPVLVIELATREVNKFAECVSNLHAIDGASIGVVVPSQPKSLKQLCLECLQQHDIPVPFSVIDEDVCRPLPVEFDP